MLKIVNEIIELMRENSTQVGEDRWMTNEEILPQLKELWGKVDEDDLDIAWWMIHQGLNQSGISVNENSTRSPGIRVHPGH